MPLIAIFALVLVLNSCAQPAKILESQHQTPQAYNNTKLKKGSLSFRAPGSWQEIRPSNAMRVKEYIIDPTSQTRLAVYFFPGMKDAVDANLERWINQFDANNRQELQKNKFNQNHVTTTVFEMQGTYLKAERPMDPSSPKLELKDHTMLAAVAETDSGTWFFKTYGQNPIISSQKANFDKLVESFSLKNS